MEEESYFHLILSHHHSDPVFGMQVMKGKKAEVIARRSLRDGFEEDDGIRF